MESYIGKLCPFCKSKFKEGDSVKVCDACGIPHHQECWDENKGCSTFGCSEQHYEPQGTNATNVCTNCEAVLGDGQEFCPKCGTPKNTPNINICGKCGNELVSGQEFCSKCGQKAGLFLDSSTADKINQVNAAMTKKKRKKALIPFIVVGIVLLGILGAVMLPNLFPNVDKLLTVGDYTKAYKVASGDAKEDVYKENIVAYISANAADSLKDKSSFELRESYISSDYSKIVLQVAAKNSYGGIVTNYWYYTYDTDKKTYSLYTTFTDLEEETTYSFDDASEKLEKILKNAALDTVLDVISNGSELPKKNVKNINDLFSKDILSEVQLIEK